MSFFLQLNYLAVLASIIVYSVIGSLWFSTLFGEAWAKEVKNHGIKIHRPTKKEFTKKIILTFVLNALVVFGVAFFVYVVGTRTLLSGIGLGIILSICFAGAILATAFNWESRSLKLSFIDIGYPFVAITVSSIILTLWR